MKTEDFCAVMFGLLMLSNIICICLGVVLGKRAERLKQLFSDDSSNPERNR